jgi:hypothetical protein
MSDELARAMALSRRIAAAFPGEAPAAGHPPNALSIAARILDWGDTAEAVIDWALTRPPTDDADGRTIRAMLVGMGKFWDGPLPAVHNGKKVDRLEVLRQIRERTTKA